MTSEIHYRIAGAINTMYALPCCEAVFGSKLYIHEYPNIHGEMTSVMSRSQVGKALHNPTCPTSIAYSYNPLEVLA